MRAELPWNVAGISPEVREAARAAARREGLSVGEWLTRRILQNFSDYGDDTAAFERPFERSPDSWAQAPFSGRRGTEDMLHRVGRSEAEASDAFRRIEEHLRFVTRRLDSAERSQSENSRAVNKAASEINLASREQAQAFDQLGSYVVGINDRLERLERTAAQDGLKNAVKALHTGLTRLADQLGHTASQSADQVAAMSRSLEQMAERLGQVHSELDATAKRLEARVATIEEETSNRFTAFETEIQRHIDQRLVAVETTAPDTQALDRAVEQLQTAQASAREADQAQLQKRHAETDGAIRRIEDNIGKLENRIADPTMEQRLDSVERALASLIDQLESHDPVAPLEDTLRDLTQRIDAVEENHGAVMDELRATLTKAKAALAATESSPYDPALFETERPDIRTFDSPPAADSEPAPENTAEAPPLAEPAPVPEADPQDFSPPADLSETDLAAEENPAPHRFADDSFAPNSFAPGDFAPVSPHREDIADDRQTAEPASDGFLAAARRSARASESEKPERSKLMITLIIGIVLVLALFAGITLSQRLKAIRPPALPAKTAAKLPAPAPGRQAPLLNPAPASQADADANASSSQAPAQPEAQAATTAAVNGPAPTLDRITQLANSGNATAQTILGLKELDGDGVPANPADGAKWLERAAQQGQSVAQYRLGAAYERGQGVTANPATAIHWYQLAAGQGNRKAMHNLAVAYAGGAAGMKDMAEAARWFAKAADLGLADSQFNLAVLYERGDGVPESLLDAYKWYAIAAGQGDAESKTRLSVIASQLSADDRNAAQKSAATFRPAPLNRTANVPPETADLAGN